MYTEGNDWTSGPIWNYATGTLNLGKGDKLNCVIQLNCREVHTHASYTTARTWENFNTRGTKNNPPFRQTMINNSHSFANRSKSITRNNLGLCKHSEIYLFRTFKNIAMDLMVQKCRFGKERYIKQINDIQEWQKRQQNPIIRWKKVMSEIYLKCL